MARKKITNQSGQTILLAILVLASVSAAGIGFATLIINQIKSTQNISNSVSAYYAASSGLEQSLYLVKKNRQNTTPITLADTIIDIENITPTVFNSNNGAKAEVEIDESGTASEETNSSFHLSKDESKQVDLHDPDVPFGDITIRKLWISWDNNPCEYDNPSYSTPACFGTGNEWVEISWIGWDMYGNSYENVQKILLSSADLTLIDEEKRYTIVPLSFIDQDIVIYRVRVKALYDDINDVEVKALDEIGGPVPIPIPSMVHIKTIGKFGRTQQALTASFPWKLPVSGIYDYVLFVEDTLKKVPGNP